ncbi:MAG: dihydroorotate dehydrogenase 2 [Candidatus Dojkabacteria bacterium]|nr:MAG: dihydroorotate dehydrogenase 2 [Candidatus Dojkabacteria bacterium]
MTDRLIKIRNKILRLLYKTVFKPIAFRQDPETVHDFIIKLGKLFGSINITRNITKLLFYYSNDKYLSQNIKGIMFKNPIGLAAGFDKNAELTAILPEVGFGFVEVGSITGEYCKGNPKPRLWRAKNSQSLVVYYGLKNDGSETISQRLSKLSFKIPVGISIAKTNSPHTINPKEAIDDYLKTYRLFQDIGDYYTINISCPNAFGGQPFTNPELLDQLLSAIARDPKTKPIFLKLSPDLSENELESILRITERYDIDGFICSNLTKNRNNEKILDKDIPEKGGLSGKVQEDLSNKQIEYIYRKYGKKYIIIGCGGIFSAQDAYNKIKLGASLLQLITGMIFEGPQLISEINRELVYFLKQDNYNNISEAVGSKHRSTQ